MDMVNNLGLKNSLLNHFMAELRDVEIQQDSMRFRKNLKRVSQIFAYEISKTFPYQAKEVTTTLGMAAVPVMDNQIVIASLMRSGLAMHEGFLDFFDKAQNAFISIYRKIEKKEKTLVKVELVSAPELENKTLIILDPMLATGISAVHAIKELMEYGIPDHIHLVVVVASHEGLDYVRSNVHRTNFTVWAGAIDDELTAQAFIVPGLGDAGDLAYGIKN